MLTNIIIPTRNEKGNIALLLQQLKYLSDKGIDYEPIVVDDSDDNTSEIARDNGATVIIGKRKGLANAVIDGIKNSLGEFIIVMDADLQHPPELVIKVVEKLYKHDLVVVSKHMKGANDELSKFRKLQSNLAVMLTQFIVPVPVSDPMAGFFGIRRKCLEDLEYGEYYKFDYSQIPLEVEKPRNWDNMDKEKWCIDNDFAMPMIGIEGIGFKIGLELFAKAKWVTHAEIPMHFRKRESGMSKGTMHSLQKHIWRLFTNSLEYDIELPKGSEEYYLFYEGDDWNRQWKADIAHLLYKITNEIKPNKTLDAGCGSSPNIRYLYGVDRIGMDIDKDALNFIRQYSTAKFIHGSVLDIPFPDKTFDMIVCCEVLEHFYEKDAKKALAELARVLQPKGHIILATPNYGSFWWNTLEGIQKITQGSRWTSDHHTKFTRDSLSKICGNYGFKEIRYDGVMGNMDMVVTYVKEN